MQRRLCCIPLMLAFLAVGTSHARNIFVLPGDNSTSRVTSVSLDPFVFGREVASVPGAFKVIPVTASKFYVLSRQTGDSVSVLEGAYPALTLARRVAVGGGITDGVLSADGRRLVLVGQAGFAVVDTATDQTLRWMGDIDVGTDLVDVAAGIDASRAYILSASGTLRAIDLVTYRVANSATVPGRASAFALGPNGLLYVSAPGAVYEYDPTTLVGRAAIRVNGTPGELNFSPDGSVALATSGATLTSSPAVVVNLAQRSVVNASTSSSTSVVFTDVAMTDNTTGFGITAQGVLYRINLLSDNTFSYAEAVVSNGALPQGIKTIDATGELPRSRYLHSEHRFRHLQTRPSSQPVVRTDRKGRNGNDLCNSGAGNGLRCGVFRVQCYADRPGRRPLHSACDSRLRRSRLSCIGRTGRIHHYHSRCNVQLPERSQQRHRLCCDYLDCAVESDFRHLPVTASIQGGQRTAQFTVTVGNPNLPGVGTLNPFQRPGLQIIAGQGQAVWARFRSEEPMRVRLNDAQGNPIPNAPITWRITRGTGTVVVESDRTNGSGQASATFTAPVIVVSTTPYEQAVVTVTAGGQQADFLITTVYADPTGVGVGGPATHCGVYDSDSRDRPEGG